MGLCSFYYTLSKFKGIKETHNLTLYTKWGVVIPKALLRGIFQSSQLVSKKPVSLCRACILISYTWLKMKSSFILCNSFLPMYDTRCATNGTHCNYRVFQETDSSKIT